MNRYFADWFVKLVRTHTEVKANYEDIQKELIYNYALISTNAALPLIYAF
jgi:hypothetical protein